MTRQTVVTEEYRPRSPGTRSRRRSEMRRERRKKALKALGIFWLVVIPTALGIYLIASNIRDGGGKGATTLQPKGPTQQTWLLVGTRESSAEAGADWLAVISHDPARKRGFLMYVPRTTYVEIPGYGQEVVSKAYSFGGLPLQIAAASNLLGVTFDHHLVLSDQSVRAMVDEMGGIEITVDQKLARTGEDGRVDVAFPEGRQKLNGTQAADFLSFTDDQGDEVARSVRVTKFLEAVIDPAVREGKARGLGRLFLGHHAKFVTDASPEDTMRFFTNIGAAWPDSVIFETLPVTALGTDSGTQLYSVDRDAMDQMVDKYLAGSRPEGRGELGRRVQILNGNGRPGIGEHVARALVPKGFRIALNGNANNFDYEETLIVVYSGSDKAMDLAKEVQGSLEVGQILISKNRQTVVDVTIVVGRDYLSKHGLDG